MDQDTVTLPSIYIARIIEFAASSAQDLQAWQLPSGIANLDVDEPITLPWPVFRDFIGEVSRISNEPAIGLMIGERLSINTHGSLGYAAINSSSIREAVQLLETYMALRTDLMTLSHEERDGLLYLRFHESRHMDPIRRLVIQAITLAVKNVIDFITIGKAGICRVAFPFSRGAEAETAQSLYGCEIVYDQDWTGFNIPQDHLDTRLTMANPAGFNEALRICRAELEKIAEQSSYAAEVRKHILGGSPSFPSLEMTARNLHMTQRTLHRRLKEEGTSYKKILEEVRHALAVKYLESGCLDIQEIAFALNYADPSNFRRAFKRWESVPPSEYMASRRQKA